MSTEVTSKIISSGPKATLALGSAIGAKLHGGETIELVSDLGGGKTTFVRGLAEGMSSRDMVRSPSFTISNQYRAGRLTLHHFDFYRLPDPGIVRRELAEVVGDPDAVVVVEWADAVAGSLPADRLAISITAAHETERIFDITCPNDLKYLLPTNT